jgi:hypothetical protein
MIQRTRNAQREASENFRRPVSRVSNPTYQEIDEALRPIKALDPTADAPSESVSGLIERSEGLVSDPLDHPATRRLILHQRSFFPAVLHRDGKESEAGRQKYGRDRYQRRDGFRHHHD